MLSNESIKNINHAIEITIKEIKADNQFQQAQSYSKIDLILSNQTLIFKILLALAEEK